MVEKFRKIMFIVSHMKITYNSKFSAHQVLWAHSLLIIVAFAWMWCRALYCTLQSSKPKTPTHWLFVLLNIDFLVSVFLDLQPCIPWGETHPDPVSSSLHSPLMPRPPDSILLSTLERLLHEHCPYPFLGLERGQRPDFYSSNEIRVDLWLK